MCEILKNIFQKVLGAKWRGSNYLKRGLPAVLQLEKAAAEEFVMRENIE